MTRKLSPYIYASLLILIALYLCLANYTPGTILSGWDVLHPEFNFSLAFSRSFFGVWRAEQGVGATAAHAHMGDLPRVVLLWLTSFVLPVNLLRYAYFFATLIAGPLGVYVFVRKALAGKPAASTAGFVAGLFYLLNLGTLQHFYVPFEMFAMQFALLPWLVGTGMDYMREGRRKPLVVFALLTVLAGASAFASTLFYAYLGAVILLFGTFALTANQRTRIKRFGAVMVVTLVFSGYWILPNLYSISTQSDVISSSKINRLFSPEAFLRNQQYGDLADVLINKSFLFSWQEYSDPAGQFVPLLDEWSGYLQNPLVTTIFYALAGVWIVGLVAGLAKKDKTAIVLLPVTAFAVFFLINDNPPTGYLYSFLRDHLSVFKEGFRLPFTKFSLLFLFATSFYAGFAIYAFANLFKGKLRTVLSAAMAFVVAGALFVAMKPAFAGNLISSSMRTQIPQDYFDLFAFFGDKPGRIAKFPVQTYSGWTYYDWGYEGAGFMPFGLANPTLDRDFDRWSVGNESFYKEVSYAVYANDPTLLEKVLRKYQVHYLVLDESVINPGGTAQVLDFEGTKDLFGHIPGVWEAGRFGKLSVYGFDPGAPSQFAASLNNQNLSALDPVYLSFGDYVERGAFYPFANLEAAGVTSKVIPNGLEFSVPLPDGLQADELAYPAFVKNNNYYTLGVSASRSGNELTLTFAGFAPGFGGLTVSDGQEFVFGNTQNVRFVSLNGYVFDLVNVDEKQTQLGQILVNPENLSATFYSGLGTDDGLPSRLLANNPRECADSNIIYDKQTNGTSVVLNGQQEAVCLGSDFSVASPAIYVFSYRSSSNQGLLPDICVSGAFGQRCVSKTISASFVSGSPESALVTFPTTLEPGGQFVDFVIPAQTSGQSAELDEFQVTRYSTLGSHDLVFPEWSLGLSGGTKKLSGSTISLAIPTSPVESEDFSLGRGRSAVKNCNWAESGAVYKGVGLTGATYAAQNDGVACDYYPYPDLDHSQAYILRLVGDNTKGRGMRIALTNDTTHRNDIEELLPEGKFDMNFVLLPSGVGSGYTLNVETRAFGRLESESTLSAVEFYPIPLAWLQNVRIGDITTLPAVKVDLLTNFHDYKYKAEISGAGVLTNWQGLDPGWIALGNGKVLEHMRVNSWANGWLVPEGVTTVTMVFWPQYLEFAGFGLLILGFAWLAWPGKGGKLRVLTN